MESAMDIDSGPNIHSLDDKHGLHSRIELDSSGLPVVESGRMYSLEEWDAMFPIPDRKPSTAQTNSGPTIRPLPVVQVTGEHVASFNNLCQQHGIVAHFTLPEIAKGCFSATVQFGSDVCEEAGPFPSKRQAKDAVAVKAIEILSAREKPKKREASDHGVANVKRKMSDVEENWIGIVVEFCQKKKYAMPVYTEYEANMREAQLAGLMANPKQFAQTLRLQPIPGRVFGSEESLFGTKSEAKKSAAKEAVLWLRANDLLNPNLARKQVKPSTPDHHTDLTQSTARMTTSQSVSQLVHDRSLQLGLSAPRYETKPGTAPAGAIVAPNFYTASAWYLEQDVDREPSLRGPLCQTEVVFGQKKAKELCSKALLGLLDGLVARRVSGQVG